MDALQAIFTRRSVRRYTGEAVSEADLETVLQAAMSAPSANNRQPWHFIVVDDTEKLAGIMDVHPYSSMLAQSKLGIVVCADTTISNKYWQQDCSAAIENMLITARAIGLGSCWLGVYPSMDRVKAVAKLFDLPENVQPMSVIALGHPAVEAKKVDRYQEARVHRNTW